MAIFKKEQPCLEAKDESQRHYREVFGIIDLFLIHYTLEEVEGKEVGFIVFIDDELDLDYVDTRERKDWSAEDEKSFAYYLGKLQISEATPCLNLSDKQILAFKRKLGGGYILALQRSFDGIDKVIRDALTFLHQRNVEVARRKFLEAGGVVALLFAVIGFVLYLNGCTNKWLYGIVFGVLGAYTSIWTRYGTLTMTGLASNWLHYLEAMSRLFIGAIFAVVAMFAIKCGLIFSQISPSIAIFAYALTSFAASFSERFIPSLIEKFINDNTDKNNEQTTDHHSE